MLDVLWRITFKKRERETNIPDDLTFCNNREVDYMIFAFKAVNRIRKIYEFFIDYSYFNHRHQKHNS